MVVNLWYRVLPSSDLFWKENLIWTLDGCGNRVLPAGRRMHAGKCGLLDLAGFEIPQTPTVNLN